MSKKTNLIMVSAVVATSVLLSGCGMFGGEKRQKLIHQKMSPTLKMKKHWKLKVK